MDENDNNELKKDEIIQKPETRKFDHSIFWSWLEDFPSLKIALIILMGIITLILLGVLFGYMAAVFNLIKL